MRKRNLAAAAVGLLSMTVPTGPADAVGAGMGGFVGTVTYTSWCPATSATVAITAEAAFTNGTQTYAGPITPAGSATWADGPPCPATQLGGTFEPMLSAWGTDHFGHRLECPELDGLAVQVFIWTMGVGPPPDRPCTLDGAPLERFSLWFEGSHVLVGQSATVSGWVGVSVW